MAGALCASLRLVLRPVLRPVGRALSGLAEHHVAARILQVCADEPLEQLELAQLTDEQVLGDGVDLPDLLGCGAVVGDDPAVHVVHCTQVSDCRLAIQRVVVPRTHSDHRARRPERLAAHGGDALGEVIGHRPHGVVLRIEHLVDRHEVHADHVPVDVLQRQLQVDEGAQTLLHDGDRSTRCCTIESGHRGRDRRRSGHDGFLLGWATAAVARQNLVAWTPLGTRPGERSNPGVVGPAAHALERGAKQPRHVHL